MNERLQKLYAYMDQFNLDAVLITLPKHVYYLTGFSSEPHERFLGLILPKGDEPFLLVPALDTEAAKAESTVSRIYTHTDTENPYEVLKRCLQGTVTRLGVEKSHLTMQRYEALSETLKAEQYVDVETPLTNMRAIKSTDEIARLKNAARLVEQVLRDGLKHVKAGVTEMEIAAELEYAMKKAGVGPAFATTVLSGEKSALPHGATGNRQIQTGDMLLFDMGVAAEGYLSDITRTFAIGDISDKMKEIYETVLEANLRGIAALRPDAVLADVDYAARQCIAGRGYGAYFTHRVGHGLGIEVHEYPSVHGDNRDLLREGMVITIEPGIYLPGIGGVRIEDDVLVTSTGSETLTTFPKQLTVIG
ncbi:M24 family metallopeptidase [Cohnella silvisoli]|uniref:Xaa-Pro peptidase family protein n=1 Tax=Cohnella silvisoli TaxID=2873699 RepID=A0ABV1KNH6_9BACL|nr:Xaa-Pro peptidase family protein [Cohnella silvisoli]MCD9021129.1 Xaa-Pro peptidase family protein [Cohnella silvisoli]